MTEARARTRARANHTGAIRRTDTGTDTETGTVPVTGTDTDTDTGTVPVTGTDTDTKDGRKDGPDEELFAHARATQRHLGARKRPLGWQTQLVPLEHACASPGPGPCSSRLGLRDGRQH